MNDSKLRLIMAGTLLLLLAACNGQNVTSSSAPDIKGAESLEACADEAMELDFANSSEASKQESQRKPDSPDRSEEEPGCTLPELSE